MDAVLERCAGLDVHQETVVACVLFGPLEQKPVSELRTFGTTTEELLDLADWLEERQCTHVAMESTGVYWKPVWNLLESYPFELLLANAHHIKNVPGRKTDIKDAEWIAKLLRSGLIEGSFVPPTAMRDLRDLTRYRKKLIQNATAEKNRMHKILQDANIKLSSYISDLFGVSGRNILQMIINGEVITISLLEQCLKGSLKTKARKLAQGLNGRLRPHHRQMLGFSWEHLMFLEKAVREIDAKMNEQLQPYREEIELIRTVPGIDQTSAAAILAEIGPDMSQFPSAGHLAAWAGVSPGNNESAGKKNEPEPDRGTIG